VSTLRRLFALVPPLPGRMALVALLLLSVTATYVAQAILIADAIASILDAGASTATATAVVSILLLVALRAVLLTWRGRVALKASGAVVATLRRAIGSKLFAMGPGWARGQRTGVLQSTMVDGVEAAEPFVARLIPQAAATLVAAAGLAAYLLAIDPMVGVVVFACSVTAPLVPMVSWRFIRRPTERWRRHYRGLYADGLDAIQGMTTLKLLNASRRRGEELARQAREFCRLSTRVILLWGPYLGVGALLVAVGTALAVGLGAVHRAQGGLSTAELLTILLLSRECFRPIKDLENAYHDSWPFRSAAREIFDLLDATPPVADGGERRAAPRAASVTFEDVTFWYEDPARQTLEAFTLDVNAGESVALVGRSGAGKTTVISLLLRLFDPQRGRIRIGGQDIATMDLPVLRRQIAVVSQDTYLFHGSIRDNLLIARPDATDAELEAAARAAHVHDLIATLPDGDRTLVGERGLTLSGGERQRIAIARALLKDAPVLVLDEATSNVDAANETGIQTALERLRRGRLTLVIAHRLSTVRNVDRVVLMDQGRIVEQGSHDALLQRRGAYARLARAQGLGPAMSASAATASGLRV